MLTERGTHEPYGLAVECMVVAMAQHAATRLATEGADSTKAL